MVKNGTSTAPAVRPSKPAVEPSKPVVKPSKPDVKPGEKPGVNPGTNPTVNPGEQVTPELDLDARVEKEISEFMRTGELKDGQFIGLGDGFDEARGGVKTVVNIKNNVIESIVFVEGQGYSGLDYMGYLIASNTIPMRRSWQEKCRYSQGIQKVHRPDCWRKGSCQGGGEASR